MSKEEVAKEIAVNDTSDIYKLFPKQHLLPGAERKLRFTDVALYSITAAIQSEYIASLLEAFYTPDQLKTKSITEASACIGGNTWSLAQLSKEVHAVELDPLHAEMLTNNMAVMKIDNVNVIQANYLDVCDELDQDVIFFDPPWGGTAYAENEEIDLAYIHDGKRYTMGTLSTGLLPLKCELMIFKLPVNAKYIPNSAFAYREEVQIIDKKERPIYNIVVLSHIKPIKSIDKKIRFDRIGYRHIKTKLIS